MNPIVIALMFGVGVGGWVWAQVGRRTGQADPKTVWMTAGGAAVAAFIFFFTLFKYVLHIG